MNISDIIKIKYPEAESLKNYKIQDDGLGPYIAEWNLEAPKPTQEDIDSWLLDPVTLLSYLKSQVEQKVRVLIESKPKEKGYDNVYTISSYVTSSIVQWKNEADAFVSWRDSVFSYCYAQLADIQNNLRPLPISVDAFISELPTLTWP